MIILRFYGSKSMMVLISYDVNTETAAGKARLRKVAKICTDYGQRVQNSVFECLLDPSQLCVVKSKLCKIIETESDSLRIYHLGNQYESKIESFGKPRSYDPAGSLIF